MKDYQVHLKIKNKVGVHYVFNWMGDSLRSVREELDLIIQCNSEEEVYDVILEQSKDTLEIVNVSVPSEKFVKMVKESENGIDEYMQ